MDYSNVCHRCGAITSGSEMCNSCWAEFDAEDDDIERKLRIERAEILTVGMKFWASLIRRIHFLAKSRFTAIRVKVLAWWVYWTENVQDDNQF